MVALITKREDEPFDPFPSEVFGDVADERPAAHRGQAFRQVGYRRTQPGPQTARQDDGLLDNPHDYALKYFSSTSWQMICPNSICASWMRGVFFDGISIR